MKNYSSLMESLPAKPIVISFANFDPPSIKHQELIETTKTLAEQHNCKHLVFVKSASRKSILSDTERLGFLKEFFPDVTFKLVSRQLTLEQVITPLSSTYKKIHLVSSVDSLAECQLAAKFLSKTCSVLIERSNCFDHDALTDKMKILSESGDFQQFKNLTPEHVREIDARRLMNEIRSTLGLHPIREEIKTKPDNLREQYLREEIFNINDIVENNGELYSIIARGSNYLTVIDEAGAISKKWLHECKVYDGQNTKKIFNKAKENMHYKTLAAIRRDMKPFAEAKKQEIPTLDSEKDPMDVGPEVDTKRTDNAGGSILRFKDMKRLMDAMNGIYEEPIEQRLSKVNEADEQVSSKPKKKQKAKDTDNESVKMLGSANKVKSESTESTKDVEATEVVEDIHSADYSYNPHTHRRFRAHVISFKNSRHGGQLVRTDHEETEIEPIKPMVKPK